MRPTIAHAGNLATLTPVDSWKERAKVLADNFRTAYQTIEHPDRDEPATKSELNAVWRSHCRLVTLLEGRLNLLTRQLQAALASDALTDEQRTAIIRCLTGTTRRDPKLLTEYEEQIMSWYRATDAKGKRMLWELLARFAATIRIGASA